jgi:TatA/E family protein of Tat protein translocase
MPTPGPLELVIILVIALLVLGPGKLPDVGAALGKSIREFRKASSDIQESVKVDTSPLPPTTAAPTEPTAPPTPAAATSTEPVAAALPPAAVPPPAAPAPAPTTPAAPIGVASSDDAGTATTAGASSEPNPGTN